MKVESKYRELLTAVLLNSSSYKDVLLNAYEVLRKLNPQFNYAYVATRTGLTRSFVRQLILGHKPLSLKVSASICQVFKLEDDLERYFLTMYHQDLAKEAEDQALVKKLEKELSIIKKALTKVSKTDSRFISSVLWPRVYASLGTEEGGATLDEISGRSKIVAREALSILEELKGHQLVKGPDGGKFYPITSHIDLGKNLLYKKIFLQGHEELRKRAEENFFKSEELFFSSVTCIKKESLPQLKNELRELMLKFIDKSESPEGDTTINLILGLYENI